MNSRFEDFIKMIPVNIHNKTKSFIGKNIAVFIPDGYVMDKGLLNEDYHIVIFQSTPPIAIIDNQEYHIKSGTLLCLSPGTDITVKEVRTKSKPVYMAISIKKAFMEKTYLNLGGYRIPKPIIYDNQYSCKLLTLLEFFMQEFVYAEEPSKFIMDSIETQIVIQLLRDMDLDPIINKMSHSQEKSYVEQAIKYIETYYNSNISIHEICSSLYVSPSHFQRIFKKATGRTPYQYLTDLRIEKSKDKLVKENNSIAEIAKLCGFLSNGHYSTVFKKSEGVTPVQYRNLHKKKE